jgi:cytochrome c2
MKISRRSTALAALLMALLSLAAPALAGGFAVVTLDELPARIAAEEPLTISFVVRQHGLHELSGLTPTVVARHTITAERLVVTALPAKGAGRYAATLTFPRAGTWEWVINDGFLTADALGFEGQPMPDLAVLDPAGAPVTAGTPQPWPGFVAGLGALGAVIGLMAMVRTRAPWAAGLTLASVMVAVVSLTASSSTATAAPSQALPSEAELGQALFLAKGCVVCHSHPAVAEQRKTFGDWRVGPDLSNVALSEEYLHIWLKDPQELKPSTQMPNLELKETEIDALAAFLLQSR